jgi:hypothetical protein
MMITSAFQRCPSATIVVAAGPSTMRSVARRSGRLARIRPAACPRTSDAHSRLHLEVELVRGGEHQRGFRDERDPRREHRQQLDLGVRRPRAPADVVDHVPATGRPVDRDDRFHAALHTERGKTDAMGSRPV